MSYPDLLLINATVITFDGGNTIAGAVAISGERISAVGSVEELLKLAGPDTAVLDVQGAAVLPGFYEAHGHFPLSGLLEVQRVALWSSPRGGTGSIPQLLDALREKAAHTAEGGWVTGFGYDQSRLAEGRHPTRYELDQAVPDHPVWIMHNSAHMGVANSKALALARIAKGSPPPAIGVIERDEGGEPTGLIQESTNLIEDLIPPIAPEEYIRAVGLANRQYLSKGITTALIALNNDPGPLVEAAQHGALDLRLISVPLVNGGPLPEHADYADGQIKVRGAKFFQDGSIQGYTGWLTNPYHTPHSEAEPFYRGFPMLNREELARSIAAVHEAGLQILIHANGDAAIDDVLYAIGKAQEAYPRVDARHRIEHAQTVREDQLDRIKELGITPSFFVDHVYYFGDNHRDIFLGEDRARRISPLQSAVVRHIRFSLHNDTPVTPADPLHLVWVAANRLTSSGRELGPEFRITPYEALCAVTIDAAWQAFEEQDKGSIEVGKLADLVVLRDNPLAADPAALHQIPVLRTLIGGKTVYERTAD